MVFLEMREKFVENDFFQGFWTEMQGSKWGGSFFKDFCQVLASSTEV